MNRGSMFVRALILVACSMTPGVLMQAQSGPCTEDAIKQNKVTVADDVFMYMTPWGRPVIGKSTARDTSNKRFADHKNVQRSWVGAHGVVSSASADMAYEYGTMQMSYDSTADGKNHTFQAVMLEVYKAKEGACQLVAETMEPLEDGNAKSAAQTQPLPETPSSEIKKLGALVGQWKLEGAEVKPGSGMGAWRHGDRDSFLRVGVWWIGRPLPRECNYTRYGRAPGHRRLRLRR